MEPPGTGAGAPRRGARLALAYLQGLSLSLKPSSGTEWSCGITAAGRAQKHRGEPEHIDKLDNDSKYSYPASTGYSEIWLFAPVCLVSLLTRKPNISKTSQVKAIQKQQTTIRKPIECAQEASSGGREWAEMTEGFHLCVCV